MLEQSTYVNLIRIHDTTRAKPLSRHTTPTMAPTNIAASQLRQLIFYNLDNDLLDNANFLAGRLHALEPRNPDCSHLLALTYLRLRRCKAAFDFSQKYGANGRHLGCAYVFAQASLQLGRNTDGITALEKAKSLWSGKSNWNKHSETTRRHLPDAAAVSTLLGRLWQAHGDLKKAGDCFIETHKANPFIWDAFEGLCKVGADLNVPNLFRPTAEMGVPKAIPNGTEIYADEQPVTSQPLSTQTNFNQQVFTPSADPFGSSRPTSQTGAHFVLPNAKDKSTFGAMAKNHLSEWDTPTANGSSVLDEDVAMGGVLIDNEPSGTQAPAAPSRRPRAGQTFETSDRPRPPQLRGHSQTTSDGIESSLQAPRKPSVGGHKRTISGQAPQPSNADPPMPTRRSNRLFGQNATTKTRPAADSTASIAGRTESRPAKTATGTKGRIGSTVGRVVSGNRKVLPPDRNDKEKDKRAPSRNSDKNIGAPGVTSATVQKPSEATIPEPDNSHAEAAAVSDLLDSFRDLALGSYSTSRFDTTTAIRTFRTLPSAQRETPFVLSQLGKAYYESADYRSAEDCFARLLKLQPSRIEDMEVYSTVLWHLKKDSALAFLCHVLKETDFHAPQTWCAVGNAFSLAREHDQAIAAFKRAIQIDESFAYAWTLMGHEYIANEEYDAALNSFRKAVAADRRGFGGWYGLGRSFEKMGKLEDAERHYRIAASINPSNATLLVCIGVILERLRNKKGALANYTRALELAPQSALARFKKARVLMHLRYFEEALQELEILRDAAPDEANVWFLLGKCYKGLGERSEALRALTTALNLDVKVSTHLNRVIDTYMLTRCFRPRLSSRKPWKLLMKRTMRVRMTECRKTREVRSWSFRF